MKLSRRTNTIIMYVLAAGLLLGMVVMFTPTLGTGFGERGQDALGAPVVTVNDQPITEEQVTLAMQRNPVFSTVQDGEVGQDLRLLLLNGLIDNELIRQASANQRVSSAEVREAVNTFRRESGVEGRQNDRAYLAAIGRMGYTDSSFRRAMEEQLRQERYISSISEGVTLSDEEARAYFAANAQTYTSEERVLARQIVVEDEALAQELHARALAGENFAELAREYSVVNPEREGAIGGAEGSTEPRAVGRIALPGPVAEAAFSLRGSGTTEVVASGGRYYLVQVEAYVAPEPQTFEEVEAQVREEALAAKRSAELERTLQTLRDNAQIVVAEGAAYSYDNAPVARVGSREIMASELAAATYGNQQVQQFLTPDNAGIITSFFKPMALESLIEQELAYQGAQSLPETFVGTRQQVARSAQNYVSQDVSVSEEDLTSYYEANLGQFTVAASAAVTRVDFAGQEEAAQFRSAVLAGAALEEAAAEHGGELAPLGTVTQAMLEPELDQALFEADGLEPIAGRDEEISQVLSITEQVEEPAGDELDAAEDAPAANEAETAEAAETTATETEATETTAAAEATEATADAAEEPAAESAEVQTRELYVVLVANRTPERVRPLDEVRDQVEAAVEESKRAELRRAWLEGLREEIGVEELLAQAQPAGPDLSFDPLPEGESPAAPEGTGATVEGEAAEGAPEVAVESGQSLGTLEAPEAPGDGEAPATDDPDNQQNQ